MSRISIKAARIEVTGLARMDGADWRSLAATFTRRALQRAAKRAAS